MNNNRLMILIFTVIAVVCYFIYQQIKIPPGVTPMGDEEAAAWLTYAGGAFAFIAAIIGVIREVVGLIRDLRNGDA